MENNYVKKLNRTEENLQDKISQEWLNSYINLVHEVINKHFSGYRKEYEDMVQSGIVGLLTAKKKYDPQKGNFVSYAYGYILGYINNFINYENKGNKRNNQTLRIRSYIKRKYEELCEYYTETEIYDIIYKEICKALQINLNKSEYANIWTNIYKSNVSKDSFLQNDDEENSFDIIDTACNIEDEIEQKYIFDWIKNAVSKYPSKDMREVYLIYINSIENNEEITFEEMGEMFGKTKQWAKFSIKKINSKLQDKIKEMIKSS